MNSKLLELDMSIFEKRYQHIVDKMVEYIPIDDDEIKIVLKDGRSLIYNPILDKLRWADRDDEKNLDGFPSEYSYRKTFGMHLESMMIKKGYTQVRLSELTGISEVSLSNYINGKATPSLYNAEKIARALRCSTSDFYSDGGND